MEEDNDVQRSWSRIKDYCEKLLSKQELTRKDIDYLGFYAKRIYDEYQYISSNIENTRPEDLPFPSLASETTSLTTSPNLPSSPRSVSHPSTTLTSTSPKDSPPQTSLSPKSSVSFPLTTTTTTTTTLSSSNSSVVTTMTATISTTPQIKSSTTPIQSPPSLILSSSSSQSSKEVETRKQLAQKLQRGSEIFFERICRWCGTGESPEWRRGPDGPKTLCNACGLKLYKRIKREKSLDKKINPTSSSNVGDASSNNVLPPVNSNNISNNFNHSNNIVTPQPTRFHYNSSSSSNSSSISSSYPSQFNSLPIMSQYPRVKMQPHETLPSYHPNDAVSSGINMRQTHQREEMSHNFGSSQNHHQLYYPSESFSSSTGRSNYLPSPHIESPHGEPSLSGFSSSSLPSQYVNDIEYYLNRAENSRYETEHPKSVYGSPTKRSFGQHNTFPSSSSSCEKNDFTYRWKV